MGVGLGLACANWLVALNKSVHVVLGIPVSIVTLIFMPTSVMTLATAGSDASFESLLIYVMAILANGVLYMAVGGIWYALRKRRHA